MKHPEMEDPEHHTAFTRRQQDQIYFLRHLEFSVTFDDSDCEGACPFFSVSVSSPLIGSIARFRTAGRP